MEKPVLILGMPRSGTSMTAGIFHLHGCWVGNCREADNLNPKGFFENLDFKKLMILHAGRLAQSGELADVGNTEFMLKVREVAPEEGPWLVKCSALYWPMWSFLLPKWVCVRRKTEGILKSNMKTNFMATQDENKIHYLIERHNMAMDLVDGVDVYTDDIVSGDFSSIKRAVEFCGLEYDEANTANFVNPKLWNRNGPVA